MGAQKLKNVGILEMETFFGGKGTLIWNWMPDVDLTPA